MTTSQETWSIISISKYSICFVIIYLKCAISVDVKPQKEKFTPDYSVYHNVTSTDDTVRKLVQNNPGFIRLEKRHFLKDLDQTQHLLHITNFTNYDQQTKYNRVKILLSFGEHAREFLPVESCLNLIKKLVSQTIKKSTFTNHDKSTDSVTEVDYLNLIDLYVIVIANPRGRLLVESKKNYCWRGTQSGVDINRNMDWEFAGKGSSGDTLDEEYHGTKPFSEFESIVYRELPKLVKFDAFLSLHSGIKQIYIPFADTKSRQTGREPENVQEMMSLAKLLSTATQYKYEFGKAVTLNDYTADGTVFDYMAGVHKIPFSYAIELWGPDNHKGPSCFDLFNPPNNRLQTVIEDLIPLYSTFFDYLIEWKRLRKKASKKILVPSLPEQANLNTDDIENEVNMSDVPSMTPGYTLLFLVVIVTVLAGLHGRYPIFRRFYQRRRVISLRSLSSTFSTNIFSP